MAVNPEDAEKIPEGMTVKECYERIYEWHKTYGKSRLSQTDMQDDDYSRAYSALVDVLPSVDRATQEDIDFVFGEVIYGLMEWAYAQEDDHGIEIAAYAHFALQTQYPEGLHDDEFRKNVEASQLFAEFGYPKWKDKY